MITGVSLWWGVWFGLIGSWDGPQTDRVLLERAHGANQAGQLEVRDACLRIWATRSPAPVVMNSTTAIDRAFQEAALETAKREGRLRVFGRFEAGRLRVGVHDPAQGVDIWRVWAVDGDQQTLLVPIRQAKGRREYQVSANQTSVIVELITTQCEAALTILKWPLQDLPDLPPQAPKIKTTTVSTPPIVPASKPEDALPWWWIATGIIAAGLVGAAVWQETR